MKALRYHAQKDFRIEDVVEPVTGEGEVKLRVAVCGICGSDIHEYQSGLVAVPTKRPHPQTGLAAPITGGHEFSGTVIEIGAGVTLFAAGDRVAVRPTLPCYKCRYCQAGRHSQCTQLATIGLSAHGGFSEFAVVRQDCLVRLPDSVSYEQGAYAEPLACGVHAVKRSGLKIGDTVAVVGGGVIGLLAMQAAIAAGATSAYLFDPIEQRRSIASRVGATATFDPKDAEAVKQFNALTSGFRADVVLECAGTPAALALADALAGRGGVIVSMSVHMENVSLPMQGFFLREKSLVFSAGYDNDDYLTALGLIAAQRVHTSAELTTARISLANAVDEGFKRLTDERRFSECKILISP